MTVTPGKWVGMGWQIFKQDAGNFVLITLVALGLAAVGNFVVAGPLLAGQFIAARRRMLEGRTDLMDLFAGFNLFVDALLIYILSTIFELFSLALCIVPIFIVAAMYLFPYLFLVDRGLSFWDAMESSRRLVMQDLLGHIWFLVLLVLVNLLGLLLFGVGLLVTIPVSVAAIAAAYQENVGFQHRPPEPARPVIIP
jgi:uncharacterized membrane protein